MPLTKQYLRYRSAGSFGVVCSKKCNVLVSERRASSKKYELWAISPALENVIVWDMRKEDKVSRVIYTICVVWYNEYNNSQ